MSSERIMRKVEGQALTGWVSRDVGAVLIDAWRGGGVVWRRFARARAKTRARSVIAGERAGGRAREARVERVLEEEDGTSLS